MKKKILSFLLMFAMTFNFIPMYAFADDTANSTVSVEVIVENTTADSSDGASWTGELFDTTVEVPKGSNGIDALNKALEVNKITDNEISGSMVTKLNGLAANNATYAGWMVTLNDWFTYQAIDYYTVDDGDIIKFMYSKTLGKDIGSDSKSTDKGLDNLTIDQGTLYKTNGKTGFAKGTKEYNLVIDGDTADLTITPEAAQKNYQVRIYKGTTYSAADTGYKRTQKVSVQNGDTILVVVGDPAWDSMNNGQYGCNAENIEAGVYKIHVLNALPEQPDDPVEGFFTALKGVATYANDETYPMTVDSDENALVTSNKTGSTQAGITLTFSKTAKLSFDFKTSTEASYDFLKITKNKTALNDGYGQKDDFSGEMTEYKNYSLEVNAGDVIKLEYYKDYSGDDGSNCIWLKNFQVQLPNSVTFHANDGTETTTEQGIFGTANLNANTFTREGYVFAGWAETAQGDIVYKDGDSITLTENKDLYAVWTKVWQVTFPNMPQNAAITVKNSDGTAITPAENGSYILANGTYTYSAGLFGYEPVTDKEFTVKDADLAIADTLAASATYAVTFAITPSDANAVIVLKNSDDEVMTATEGVYNLPAGKYTYTITAKGYKSLKNQEITVTNTAQNIEITLEVSNVWDGTTAEPTAVDGVYQIDSGEKLAWFAAQVNGGNTSINAILTKDINLNSDEFANVWTSIGNADNGYNGNFNGNGKTISGLYQTDESAKLAGLFGKVNENAVIENIVLDNAKVTTKNTNTSDSGAGLVAGYNKGTIKGCFVQNSEISGTISIGGLCGTNEGTISGCGNDSANVLQNAAKDSGIGGIVGQNIGTVELCYNKGSIINQHGKTTYGYAGGIAGLNTGTVENVYSTGNVGDFWYSGTIIGSHKSGKLNNAYSTGAIQKSGTGVIGSGSGANTNSYYLEGTLTNAKNGTAKTEAELKALAGDLGGSFENDLQSNINSGYPILKWQNPNATYSITINVLPENANVTLKLGEQTITPESSDNGIFKFTGLAKGTYAYTVSGQAADDYAPESGSLTVANSDITKNVTLNANQYTYTFSGLPAKASVIVRQGDSIMPTEADGSFKLVNGDYTYTVTAFGYDEVQGQFTVNRAGGNIEISMNAQAKNQLTFTVDQAAATVTVTHAADGIQTPDSNGVYNLIDGEYTYSVKLKGYKTERGTVTMAGAAQNITINMTASSAWEGDVDSAFAGGSGTEADPYLIENGDQLAYLSKVILEDNSNYNDKYYKLDDDIDMGGQAAFTPIGNTGSRFKGHFDGANHTISNLKIERTEQYTALFGYIHSAEIKNVTLINPNIKGGMYTGSFAGYAAGSASAKNTISNCAVINGTIAGSRFVGGIGAYMAQTDIKECAVVADITGTDTSYGYAGGIIGQASGGCIIDYSFARGKVTAKSDYAAGLTGSFSGTYIRYSYADVDVTTEGASYGYISGNGSFYGDYGVLYNTDRTCTGLGDAHAPSSFHGKTSAELQSEDALTALNAKEVKFALNNTVDTVTNEGFPYLISTYAETIKPQVLAQVSNAAWNNETATWNAVDNAVSYKVALYKDNSAAPIQTYDVTETSLDLSTALLFGGSGDYTFTVQAIADNKYYKDGPVSEKSAAYNKVVNGANVTFSISLPEGMEYYPDGEPIITAEGNNKTITLSNNTACFLPKGTYQYTIRTKGYETITGSVTVDAEAQVITKTLAKMVTWDGSFTLEPAQDEDGTYLISNGPEMAWFAAKVNEDCQSHSGSAINGKLIDNINLGNFDWTPIGAAILQTGYKYYPGYKGTFDGNGKTVSGLKIDNQENSQAFFGYVTTGAVIKNLTVEGSVTAKQFAGGIISQVEGGAAISNCVNNVNVTTIHQGNAMTGGIVGYVKSNSSYPGTTKIENCVNNGTITGSNAKDSSYIGGITGNVSNTDYIKNCVNNGAVNATGTNIGGIVGNLTVPVMYCQNTAAVNGKTTVGGIAGFTNKEVTNCYNTGAVSGTTANDKNGIGGIVGNLHSKYGGRINGCYNTGTVTAETGQTGGLAGYSGDATVNAVTASYYLENTASAGVATNGNEADVAAPKTEAEMKTAAMAGLLGGQFATTNNGSYPVLKWQNDNAKYVTYILPDPIDSAVTLAKDGVVQTAVEAGVYLLTDAGSYTYTVSKEKYDTQTGTVEFDNAGSVTKVTLANQTFNINFDITPADTVITVKDSAGETVAADENGKYKLPNGNYTYTVSKFGYESVNGAFEVADAEVNIPAITLQASQTYTVTFNITPADAPDLAITVKNGEQAIAGENNVYTLPDGTYSYEISATGYFKTKDEVTVDGENQTLDITLQERTTWNGTAEQPTPISGVYQITCAEELAWFAQQVNAGHTDYNAKLLANIYINDELSSNVWTSIGTYSNQYAGTFDGNGKTVYGLKGNNDDNQGSLFGFVAENAAIKNVSVTGEITGTSNVGAIARTSYGTFENCKNYANVTATNLRTGGIVGIAYGTSALTNCVNYGKITSTYTGAEYLDTSTVYLGGIAGFAYCSTTGCVNYGEVAATGKNYGGVGGIAGATEGTINNCYNTAKITGSKRIGGIVGLANAKTTAQVTNCYSVGEMNCTGTSYNNFVGGIAGSINNSNGLKVGTVNNCYFLNTVTTNGIGYGTDDATAKTAEEMKADSFANVLGEGFNADARPNFNNGYPVVKWQGGRIIEGDTDAEDVAADKAALTLDQTDIKAAGSLTLPASGENGTTITWTSSNTDIINNGVVTLPESGKVEVKLTAKISKNGVFDTKEFTVTVWSQSEIDKAELEEAASYLGSSPLKPIYGTDTNVVDMVQSRLSAKYNDITVTISNPVNTDYIGNDGKITYYYQDLSQAGPNFAAVNDVTFTLTKGNETKAYSVNTIIGWDGAKVSAWLTANILPQLTFEQLKGENTTAENVTANLSLPVSLSNCAITWTAEEGAAAVQLENSSVLQPVICKPIPQEDTTNVKLKANIVFTRTSDYEPQIAVNSNLEFTVIGQSQIDYEAIMRQILDENYTVDKLTYSRTGEVIDAGNVTENFKLLRYRDLGISVTDYTLSAEAKNSQYLDVNGSMANVYKDLNGEHDAVITVKLTHKATGKSVTKDLTFHIAQLTQAEINTGLELMERVKANYFEGIKGDNTAQDNITTNMHGFREACDDGNGGLTWIYSYADDKYTGIRVTDIPKEGYDESYNLYHSSNATIISHENLLLQKVPENNADITITSQLCYAPLANYAEKYPGNADLQKLAGTPVSVTVKVRGSSADQVEANQVYDLIKAIGTVTAESGDAISAARTAYDNLNDNQKALVDNYEVLTAAENAYAELTNMPFTMNIAADNAKAFIGGQIAVSLIVNTNDQANHNTFGGVEATLNYNSDLLTFQSADSENINAKTDGKVKFVDKGEPKTIGDGKTVVTMTFTVKDTIPEGNTNAVFSVSDAMVVPNGTVEGKDANCGENQNVILANYTVTLPQEATNVTGNKADGSDITFKLPAAPDGQQYTVTYTIGSSEAKLLAADDNSVYRIPAESITDNVTVTLTSSISGTVSFIEFDTYKAAPTGYKVVKFVPAGTTEGIKYQYNGKDMFRSNAENYNCYLFFVTEDTTEAQALAAITAIEGANTAIAYQGDVNLNGNIKIDDAQLVYDLYSNWSGYLQDTLFTAVPMQNRLEADVNGDGTVDVQDAQMIVRMILGSN